MTETLSPEAIHFVLREDGTLETHVNAAGDFSGIFPAAVGRKVEDALTKVKGRLATATLSEVIAEDRREWPDGHPCRDCGKVAKDHPVEGCEGWR